MLLGYMQCDLEEEHSHTAHLSNSIVCSCAQHNHLFCWLQPAVQAVEPRTHTQRVTSRLKNISSAVAFADELIELLKPVVALAHMKRQTVDSKLPSYSGAW